jgi:predicted phage replisome organizer
MKKLRKIAGGDTYTIIYLKLQLLSLQDEGDLHYEGVEESLLEELALDIDETVENVQATMFFLEKCGLVTEVSDSKVSLPEVKENTGTETSSAERVRKHREKKKQLVIGVNEGQNVLQCNNEVTKGNTEIEIEKELEKEKEREKSIKKFSPPTLEQITEYMTERKIYNANLEAEKFFDYYSTIGWVVGKAKNKMKDWKAAVRNWTRKSFNDASTAQTPNITEHNGRRVKWASYE